MRGVVELLERAEEAEALAERCERSGRHDLARDARERAERWLSEAAEIEAKEADS